MDREEEMEASVAESAASVASDLTASETPRQSEETAWLIEEVWSGYVHYLHRDFHPYRWLDECNRLRGCPPWVRRREEREPFITKDVADAMRFPSKGSAEGWLKKGPHWLNSGQYEPREHMWSNTPKSAATEGEGSGAFTPGPWLLEDDDWGHRICMGDAITSPYDHETHNLIQYEHGCAPEEVPEQYAQALANARLIAAAPELYEALKELCAEDGNAIRGMALGVAAIAKAEGRL